MLVEIRRGEPGDLLEGRGSVNGLDEDKREKGKSAPGGSQSFSLVSCKAGVALVTGLGRFGRTDWGFK